MAQTGTSEWACHINKNEAQAHSLTMTSLVLYFHATSYVPILLIHYLTCILTEPTICRAFLM
jgi:hypothetical protein